MPYTDNCLTCVRSWSCWYHTTWGKYTLLQPKTAIIGRTSFHVQYAIESLNPRLLSHSVPWRVRGPPPHLGVAIAGTREINHSRLIVWTNSMAALTPLPRILRLHCNLNFVFQRYRKPRQTFAHRCRCTQAFWSVASGYFTWRRHCPGALQTANGA